MKYCIPCIVIVHLIFAQPELIHLAHALQEIPQEKLQWPVLARVPDNHGHTMEIQVGTLLSAGAQVVVDAANQETFVGSGITGMLQQNAHKHYNTTYHQNVSLETFVEQEWRKNKQKTLSLGQAALNKNKKVRVIDSNTQAIDIIHAVGPNCSQDESVDKLKETYTNSLKIAHKNNFESIAFPAISTGFFGCDITEAGKLAVNATLDFFAKHPESKLKKVIFVVYKGDTPTKQDEYYQSYAKPLGLS